MTVKQCTSVAHQFGKKYVLTETYAGTGWDFSLEGQKWCGDWQYALGVGRRCQHLALYSLRGCRKRDYPPSFHYNSVWWKYSPLVENYFARLGMALREGEPVRNIVLLHPASTIWMRLGVDPYGNPFRGKERDIPALNEYGNQYNELIHFMMEQHFDCDLGDEILMKDSAQVEDKIFKIGKASYDAVVIPQVDTLFTSTYTMLTEFLKNGGRVILLGKAPCLTDGDNKKEDIRELFLSQSGLILLKKKEELNKVLADCRKVSIYNDKGEQQPELLYQLRRSDKSAVLFVANTDRNTAYSVKIELPYRGRCDEMDLMSGECREAEGIFYCCERQKTVIETVFEGCDSKLYYIDFTKKGENRRRKPTPEYKTEYLPSECSIQLSGPNVLTLDMCRYRLCGEEVSETMEVWEAQRQIRGALGMRQIYLNGKEQRYRWIHAPHPMDGKSVELRFDFCAEKAMKGLSLVLEKPKDFELILNSMRIDAEDTGWYLDKAFRMVRLPEIKAGKNELILRCLYRNSMELENIYLLGDFSVTPKRHLAETVTRLHVGDWCRQGLAHYCGSVRYQYDYEYRGQGERVELITDAMATCMSVLINEKEIEVPWQLSKPVDITGLLKYGRNSIEIVLVGSQRNMLGPLHNKKEGHGVINDKCFCPEGNEAVKDYILVPYGLKSRPLIRIY